MSIDPFIDEFNRMYDMVMIGRRVELGFGCFVLAYIVVDIVRRKLYGLKPLYLYMCCCFSYLIGMFIVFLHCQYFTSGYKFSYPQNKNSEDNLPINLDYLKYNIIKQMRQDFIRLTFCGFEGFINCLFYNFAALFSMLLNYNTRCILAGDSFDFIKKIKFSRKYQISFLLIVLIYLIPFVVMYVFPKDNDFYYEYGPIGLTFQKRIENSTRKGQLLLLCFGTTANSPQNQDNSKIPGILLLINIYLISLILFAYNTILIISNRKKIKDLQINQSELNYQQKLIIKSDRLSLISYFIQILGLIRLAVQFVKGYVEILELVMSYLLDLYPLLLFFFYVHYLRKKNIQRDMTVSLFENQDD